MPLNIFAIGASRNIGYFAAVRLLGKNAISRSALESMMP